MFSVLGGWTGQLARQLLLSQSEISSTASELVWGVEQAVEGWKQDVFVGQAAPRQPFLCIRVSVAPWHRPLPSRAGGAGWPQGFS